MIRHIWLEQGLFSCARGLDLTWFSDGGLYTKKPYFERQCITILKE